MARNLGALARQLTVTQIQSLLSIKQRLAAREKLQAELKSMDALIDRMARGTAIVAGSSTRRRRRRKATAKATARTGRVARKAAARVGRASAITRRGRGRDGKSLEQTIVDVIKGYGKPMPFPIIKSTIMRGKLFKTRSSNFDNVLRRTISASRAIKRVRRGVYTA
jgi:hypothetical protein